MTYNVFSGTLNLTLSIYPTEFTGSVSGYVVHHRKWFYSCIAN